MKIKLTNMEKRFCVSSVFPAFVHACLWWRFLADISVGVSLWTAGFAVELVQANFQNVFGRICVTVPHSLVGWFRIIGRTTNAICTQNKSCRRFRCGQRALAQRTNSWGSEFVDEHHIEMFLECVDDRLFWRQWISLHRPNIFRNATYEQNLFVFVVTAGHLTRNFMVIFFLLNMLL